MKSRRQKMKTIFFRQIKTRRVLNLIVVKLKGAESAYSFTQIE